MAKVYDSILDLVGKTPLVELKRIEEKEGLQAKLIAKVESFNPAGSVKDRIAKAMIEDAEAKGLLKEGSVIIEPTSGNTGIGLAAAATVKGYRMILTMPETMSVERRNIVKAYGAEVVLTDGTKGMKGAIEKADELAKEIPNSFIAGQFVNPANPETHKKTTGPEIWEDTYALGREIAQTDGVFLGQSAGAALHAATIVAQRPENAGKNIVVILADNGMKYLSTNMYPLDKKVQ